MHGIVQVISLMLALGGFGIEEDKKAPSADTVLEYAVEDADAMIHADVAAVAPHNYKELVAVADDPAVKANPDLLQMVKSARTNIEGVRAMAKQIAGVDIVEDVTSVTLFFDVVPGKDVTKMAVVRGKLPSDLIDKVTKVAGGTSGKIDGRATLELDAETFLGMTKDGTLIVGPKSWVEPRVDDDWKAPKRKKGSTWATIAKYLDEKPFLMFAGKIAEADAEAYAKEIGPGFLADLVTSHELHILALHHDGLVFHWKDKTKEHLDRMELAAEGVIELMRAGHLAPRGMVKLLVAALDSYKGVNTEVDELIAHKDELQKIVESYSGDGDFDAKIKKDKKARTLTVRATGKKLSDVVPVAALIPAVVVGILWSSEKPEPAPKPKKKQPTLKPLSQKP